MSKLQVDFNAIIAKIEERITDEELLNFLKQQIADISMLYINELNKVMDLSERRVNQVVENQRVLEKKQQEFHNTIELDWNQGGEDECGGHCGSCGGCEHAEEVEEIEVVTDEIEEDNEEDDDM